MTVFYPDVSHYQAGLSLVGAVACVAKATEGGTFSDVSYVDFREQAALLGTPFAAYHWLNATDAFAQASHAFSVVGAGTPLMVDAEAFGANVAQILSFTQDYRALGGRVTMCYLPHWWWLDIGSPDLTPLRNNGLALVSSNYPVVGYTSIGSGWQPYGGVVPTIWQYTDAQPFNGQRVDFNAFRGDIGALRAVFDGSTVHSGGISGMTPEEHQWLMRVHQRLYALSAQLPSITVDGPGDEPTPGGTLLAHLSAGTDVAALSAAILGGLDYARLATEVAVRLTQRPMSVSLSGTMSGSATPQGM